MLHTLLRITPKISISHEGAKIKNKYETAVPKVPMVIIHFRPNLSARYPPGIMVKACIIVPIEDNNPSDMAEPPMV